ncbi:MAG: deoxyguanosinetriphosphate triphosphohydrolase [Clostridia bacterium]|nr:deoxyguanosinetriphosphate triphosphohydrolase [Clostridia bacterium]
MTIREQIEANERTFLSEFATKSAESLGRKYPDEPCPYRTEFQRDRDRIIHSKAFRRLKHKTQVFLAPEGDHYRTRLTHTLEVSQIARTVARALALNEDLAEAISLGHDLGHTPFGHAGERALSEVCPFEFKHYEQSVRVCECLERDGRGLNLTAEVLDGIRCHTDGTPAFTPEGRIVRFADRIAYICHDIDDSIRAGILCNEDIPAEIRKIIGNRHSERINAFVGALVSGSHDDEIAMMPDVYDVFNELHGFMFKSVYCNPAAKGEEGKAQELVQKLYFYYCDHPEKLTGEYKTVFENEGAERASVDFISSMSDRYAVNDYSDLFIPRSWGNLN